MTGLDRAPNAYALAVPLAFAIALLLSWRAVATPELVLAALAALAFVTLSIWNLVAGLAVYTVLTFPEQLPGFAEAGSLAKPAGLVLAFSWVLLLLSRRSDTAFLPRDQPVVAVMAAGLLVWAAASALWAADAGASVSSLARLIQVALLFLIVYSAVRTTRDIQILAYAYLVGALLTAVYSMATGGYSEDGRLAGIFDSNFFAAQLVAAMSIGFFLVLSARRWSVRFLLAAMLATYAVAFALTESRGGLVALGTTLVALVAFSGRWRQSAIAIGLFALAVAIAYYGSFAADSVRERITNVSAAGSSGRVDEWQIGLQMVRDHPLRGVGLGNFSVLEPLYAARDVNLLRPEYALELRLEAHNTYLHLATELGLVGLCLFVGLVVVSFLAGFDAVRRFERSGDLSGEAVTRGLVVATVGILAAYVFLSGIYEKQLWLLLGILVSADLVARTREQVDLPWSAGHERVGRTIDPRPAIARIAGRSLS